MPRLRPKPLGLGKRPVTKTVAGFGGDVIEGLPIHQRVPTNTCEGWLSLILGVCSGKLKTLFFPYEERLMAYAKLRSVFVRAYRRFRYGRWEYVCQHWRSHPGQLSFPF